MDIINATQKTKLKKNGFDNFRFFIKIINKNIRKK